MKAKIKPGFFVACLVTSLMGSGQHDSSEVTFAFDHIVIFANNGNLEDSLSEAILSPAHKLRTQHMEQGTLGHYFLFYNTFIEFLYLEDTAKALANESKFGSAYTKRWETANGSCPFGFGLNPTPFDTALLGGAFNIYQSLDAPEDEFYLMSVHNKRLDQPLLYLSMPHRAYRAFTSLEEIDQRVEAYKREDLKSYLTHPGGIKKLTEVRVKLPVEKHMEGNTALLKGVGQIKIEKSETYGLTLVFDHHIQGKEYSIQGDYELIIQY